MTDWNAVRQALYEFRPAPGEKLMKRIAIFMTYHEEHEEEVQR